MPKVSTAGNPNVTLSSIIRKIIVHRSSPYSSTSRQNIIQTSLSSARSTRNRSLSAPPNPTPFLTGPSNGASSHPAVCHVIVSRSSSSHLLRHSPTFPTTPSAPLTAQHSRFFDPFRRPQLEVLYHTLLLHLLTTQLPFCLHFPQIIFTENATDSHLGFFTDEFIFESVLF